MAGKRKNITPYIVLTHAQAEVDGIDSIDAFSDSLVDVFHAATSGYTSSDTHHVCDVGDNNLPVDADGLSISYDPLSFEELKDLSATKAFGFNRVPWAGKKNVQVFVAK